MMGRKVVSVNGMSDPVDLHRLKSSARKGDMSSQALLSFLYLQGNGVRKSDRKAYKWMLKSAEQGNGPAMHSVSIFLRDGVGVAKDNAKSIEWLQRAVDIGYHDSQLVMGNYLATGIMMPKDIVRGTELLKASSAQGNPMAKLSLAMMNLYSEDIANRDVQGSISLLEEASDSGCTEATEVLSTIYLQGVFVPENSFLGNRYVRKAAEQGSAVASLVYGSQLIYGSEYVQKDQPEGFGFLLKAYGMGVKEACPVLGEAYLMGLGTEVDVRKAREMFEVGVKDGSVTSLTNLGVMYMRGIGVEKNADKAREMLEEAYSKGSCAAACNLGSMYATGEIVERDAEKAREWYTKAAEMNEIDVSDELKELEG